MDNANRIDLVAIRERLEGKSGPTYWRGLEEIAETEEFRQWLDDEFPNFTNPRSYRFSVKNPTTATHDFHVGVLCMNLP